MPGHLFKGNPVEEGTSTPPGHMQKENTPRPSTCSTKEYSAAGTPGFHCPWYWHQLIFSCGCSTRTPIAKPFASSAPPAACSISYTSRAECPVARITRDARNADPFAQETTKPG